MPTVTHFNSVLLSGVNIEVGFPYGSDGPYTTQPNFRQRINQVPVQESLQYGDRSIPFIAFPSGTISDAAFRTAVYKYLSPFGPLRELRAVHDDGSTVIAINCNVGSLQKETNRKFVGTFTCPNPVWAELSTNTSTSSPTTNAGAFSALPVISITPTSSTVKRSRITIADNTARGLSNYPVLIVVNSTGVSATLAANYIAFVNGRSVPISVTTPNNASTRIWLRVDVPHGGSTNVDLYFGSSVSNSLAGTFNDGGMDLTDSSNSIWWYDDLRISLAPNATGIFRPGKLGLSLDGTSFGELSEAATDLRFYVEDNASGANDADCAIVTLGVEAASVISGLGRQLTLSPSDGIIRAFVKYRQAFQTTWTTAWSESIDSTTSDYATNGHTNTAVTSSITITNAVEIAFGIEPQEGLPRGSCYFYPNISGLFSIALANYPTVTVGTPATARVINAVLTNNTNGATIVFTNLYMDDVALSVDCALKKISPASGPFYGDIALGNPDDWFPLSVGSNSWSWSTGTYTTSISYSNRYLI